MNLRQIEVFRAVMLAGGASAAGEMLHVSQPAISRSLKYLEQRLGLTLFNRAKGRLVPTREAQLLFAEIEKLYRGVDRLRDFAQGLKSGQAQVLRIVSNPSTARDLVPIAMANIRASLPDLRMELELLPAQEMAGVLSRDEADVGVGSMLDLDDSALESELIGRGEFVCVLPAGHPLAVRKVLSARDLADQPLIGFGVNTLQSRVIERFFAQMEDVPVPVVRVRYADTACRLVEAGLGIAIVDGLSARGRRVGSVVTRPLKPRIAFETRCVWNPGAGGSLAREVFVAELKQAWRRMEAAAA